MRAVNGNNCLAIRVFRIACVWCRVLTGSARRREVSGLAEGSLKSAQVSSIALANQLNRLEEDGHALGNTETLLSGDRT